MTDSSPPDLHSHIYKTKQQKCYFSKKLWAVVSGCRSYKLIVPEQKCQVCLWNLCNCTLNLPGNAQLPHQSPLNCPITTNYTHLEPTVLTLGPGSSGDCASLL